MVLVTRGQGSVEVGEGVVVGVGRVTMDVVIFGVEVGVLREVVVRRVVGEVVVVVGGQASAVVRMSISQPW